MRPGSRSLRSRRRRVADRHGAAAEGPEDRPVFLTDRRARVELPPCDIDPASGRARLSYRQAADLFKAASGGATLHQFLHSALTHADADGQVRAHLGRVAAPIRATVRRGPGPVAGAERPGTTPVRSMADARLAVSLGGFHAVSAWSPSFLHMCLVVCAMVWAAEVAGWGRAP